jgi:hypothetical protein
VRGEQLVHDEVVAGPLQVAEQVRGQQNRGALLGDPAHERLQELAPGERVQARHRLVQQQQVRPLGEGERERDLRSLAAGQPADAAVQRDAQVAQPVAGQHGVPSPVQPAAHRDVLGRGEVRVERGVLRHEPHPVEQARLAGRLLAEHAHRTGVRPGEADREIEQRALSGAVRPDQGGDPPGG